jgi:hypothetical protein
MPHAKRRARVLCRHRRCARRQPVLDPIRDRIIDRAGTIASEFLRARRRHELVLVIFPQPAFVIQSDPATPMPAPLRPSLEMRIAHEPGRSIAHSCLKRVESSHRIVQETQLRRVCALPAGAHYGVVARSIFGECRRGHDRLGRYLDENIWDWKLTRSASTLVQPGELDAVGVFA